MKYKTLIIPAFALLFGVALTVSADTFQYVDVQGNLRMVEAPNAQVALEIAPNKASNSGVMFVSSNGIGGIGGGDPIAGASLNTYSYVDVSGNVREVMAFSASNALEIAPNKAPNSGVMLVD